MKFNVQVEIDWVDDSENLDEQVQNEIKRKVIDEVASKIFEKNLQQVEKDELVRQSIKRYEIATRNLENSTKNISEKVESKIKLELDKLLKGKVVISDGWGDRTRELRLKELVKDKIKDITKKENIKDYLSSRVKNEFEKAAKNIDWHIEKAIEEEKKLFLESNAKKVADKILQISKI